MELLKEDIKKIWFGDGNIHLQTIDGREKSMPLSWFPRLANADKEQLNNFSLSPYGIHWEKLNEDLSFSGFFTYNKDRVDSEKSEIQKILTRLPFLNLEEVSKMAGISATLVRHYACGIKKPSAKRTEDIKKVLRKAGEELLSVV